jgi:thioesterase-3
MSNIFVAGMYPAVRIENMNKKTGTSTQLKNTIEIQVFGFHLDLYGHVNNARYLEFLEQGRWELFESTDLPGLFKEKGWGFAAVNINIDYRYPAGYGETLVVTTSLKKIGNKSAVFHQLVTIKGTDTVVAEADVTFVILDLATGRAVPVDESTFSPLIR